VVPQFRGIRAVAKRAMAMKTLSSEKPLNTPQARSHVLDRLSAALDRYHERRLATRREPTVEQIVDRIMALDCGEWCEVQLNPHITHIANLKWLLPICVQQFGTAIAIWEQPDGDHVILTIAVTARRRPRQRPALAAQEERLVGEPAGVA